MAERQAICEESLSGLPLPSLQVTDQQPTEAPAPNAGSFLDERTRRGDPTEHAPAAYRRYLQLHKGLVPFRGARSLTGIYQQLADETEPKHLMAAGWAAVEAGLITHNHSAKQRLTLLEGAANCWEQAKATLEARKGTRESGEPDAVLRAAFAIATLPQLEAVIAQAGGAHASRQVFEAHLAIAKENAALFEEAKNKGKNYAAGTHYGFAYECLTTLIKNRELDNGRFMMPTIARADTGYHYPEQTHDLLCISQHKGQISGAIPIEVKSTVRGADTRRYKALLVSGPDDLCIGDTTQAETLKQLELAHHYPDDPRVVQDVNRLTDGLLKKMYEYTQGQRIKSAVSWTSRTKFYQPSGSPLPLGQTALAS